MKSWTMVHTDVGDPSFKSATKSKSMKIPAPLWHLPQRVPPGMRKTTTPQPRCVPLWLGQPPWRYDSRVSVATPCHCAAGGPKARPMGGGRPVGARPEGPRLTRGGQRLPWPRRRGGWASVGHAPATRLAPQGILFLFKRRISGWKWRLTYLIQSYLSSTHFTIVYLQISTYE